MRRIILRFALVAPLLTIALWRTTPVGAIGVLALSHALILLPTLLPNLQWLGPVVTSFTTDRRELWLTIDDGPTDDTQALLDLLQRLEVKATFFVKGELAERHPDRIREMVARGHAVANHSHTHPSGTFWCLGPKSIAAEIDRCSAALQRAEGTDLTLFRAPVGMKNPAVHPHLRRRAMTLIGWSARGFDATMGDEKRVLQRLQPRVFPGAIIVLHQGRTWSLAVIEHVLTAFQALGYEFVIPEPGRLKTKR